MDEINELFSFLFAIGFASLMLTLLAGVGACMVTIFALIAFGR